jgi:SAM-dependent methyltransferase
MKHFHSADAYGSNPFVMFVNAYLHTLSTKFLRPISFAQPSVELGAGDGSLSDFVFAGRRLTLVSSVVPADIPHLAKRSIPEKIAIIDAEEIPLPGESVNFVFMVNTLYHIGNQGRAIAEVSRVLQRGGLFAFNYILPEYLLYASPGQRWLATLGVDRWRRTHLERLKQAHFIDVSMSFILRTPSWG